MPSLRIRTVIVPAILGDVVVGKGLPFGIGCTGGAGHGLDLGLLLTFEPALDVVGIVDLDLDLDQVEIGGELDQDGVERSAVGFRILVDASKSAARLS